MVLKFSITVLGAPRSGKTSLLSSIYKQFDKVVDNSTTLEIKPAHLEATQLSNEIDNLKSAFNSITKMPLNNADVVPSTTLISQDTDTDVYEKNIFTNVVNFLFLVKGKEEKSLTDREYRFNLGKKSHKPKLQLVLRDYPGEQLIENTEDVINRVRECNITIITIDTPSLMVENDQAYKATYPCENNNLPEHIAQIIDEAYTDTVDKRLVIVAPVKCEEWMSTFDKSKKLTDRINEKYKCLFDVLSSDELHEKVAVVITPVETLGGIVYAYMDNKEGYSPRFIKKNLSSTYDPKYCDQPLRYILRFVIKRFLENSGAWFTLFGDSKSFTNAIGNFTKECLGDSSVDVKANGFLVVQGSNLL
ncbi:hypothetical protein CLV58_13536 [Spirosoma oryzae]|uniref:Uncharacterized protein n=1 Tax=Spirosoma oryzae TaxID=1469603 RepID=A0A2T0S0S7_9BACT|nr:hypothetical protein [Spirosoma oryzae]PRY27034.1 hypothetical protein CLV58_13536 [Spirosoma oryzae]